MCLRGPGAAAACHARVASRLIEFDSSIQTKCHAPSGGDDPTVFLSSRHGEGWAGLGHVKGKKERKNEGGKGVIPFLGYSETAAVDSAVNSAPLPTFPWQGYIEG